MSHIPVTCNVSAEAEYAIKHREYNSTDCDLCEVLDEAEGTVQQLADNTT